LASNANVTAARFNLTLNNPSASDQTIEVCKPIGQWLILMAQVPRQTTDVAGPMMYVPGQTTHVAGQTTDVPGQTTDVSSQYICVPGQTTDVPGQTTHLAGRTTDVPGQVLLCQVKTLMCHSIHGEWPPSSFTTPVC
jgi:hypothetical protein